MAGGAHGRGLTAPSLSAQGVVFCVVFKGILLQAPEGSEAVPVVSRPVCRFAAGGGGAGLACGIRKKMLQEVQRMDVDLIFRIAAIGIIVSVLYQVLLRSGREEQAMLTSLAGLIVVLMMMIQEISNLFETVKTVFGL